MLAIIIAAINDALGCSPVNDRGQRDRESAIARRWFEEAGRDFHEVCHLAGLDPASLRNAALAYITRQEAMPHGRKRGLTIQSIAASRRSSAQLREAA